MDPTAEVATVKVADLEPAATDTFAGTLAMEALDVRLTERPPVGAGLEIFTIPVALLPPTTEVGDTVSEDTVWAMLAPPKATSRSTIRPFASCKSWLPIVRTIVAPKMEKANRDAG